MYKKKGHLLTQGSFLPLPSSDFQAGQWREAEVEYVVSFTGQL